MPLAESKVFYFGDGTSSIKKRFFGYLYSQTLASMVAAIGTVDQATLEIHGAVSLSSDLDIPANITVIMKAGSKITLSGTATELFIANCICEGPGPHFSIGSGCWALFGRSFTAPPYRIFEGSGLSNVRFGLGIQNLVYNRRFEATSGWSGITGNWSLPSAGNLTATTATTAVTQAISPISGGEHFWGLLNISAFTAGELSWRIGNAERAFTTAGLKERWFDGANTNPFSLGVNVSLSAVFSYASCRNMLGGIPEIRAEWWGAIGDGVTDNYAAIQAAIIVASGLWHAAPLPHVLRFGPGIFLYGTHLNLIPWCQIVGDPQGTVLKVKSTIAEAKGISVNTTYGGYGATGDRVFMDVLRQLKFDCSAVAKDFTMLSLETDFNAVGITNCRFKGHPSTDYQQVAIDVNPNDTGSYNSMWIRDCGIKDHCSYKIVSGVVNDKAAIFFRHDDDMQNIVLHNIDFNCPGRHLALAGANNRAQFSNFQATPYAGIAITRRGAFIAPTPSSVTAANPCVLFFANAATTHFWSNTSNRQVYVTFTGGTGWSALNGLYEATFGFFGTPVTHHTITLIGCDTSTCTGTPTITCEFVGGFTTRAYSFGNAMQYNSCYFDGTGYRIDLLGTNNTGLSGNEEPFIVDECVGITSAGGLGEMLCSGSFPYPVVFWDATRNGTAKNQLKISGDVRSSFVAGNYIYVYQYTTSPSKVYGFIKVSMSTVTYSAPDTIITIPDEILRGDTVIKVTRESATFKDGTNFWLRSRGKLLNQRI